MSSVFTTYGNLNRIGIKDSPVCPLCSDAEEMDLDHIQKCQKLADDLDLDWDKW
jgi:hypothetical protein